MSTIPKQSAVVGRKGVPAWDRPSVQTLSLRSDAPDARRHDHAGLRHRKITDARQRLKLGVYDDPAVLDAALDRLLDTV